MLISTSRRDWAHLWTISICRIRLSPWAKATPRSSNRGTIATTTRFSIAYDSCQIALKARMQMAIYFSTAQQLPRSWPRARTTGRANLHPINQDAIPTCLSRRTSCTRSIRETFTRLLRASKPTSWADSTKAAKRRGKMASRVLAKISIQQTWCSRDQTNKGNST